jgi:EAL domain-containing protein (putative c-di-GMP-specific phosphodiesterase class I)
MGETRLLAVSDDKATQAVLGRLCRKRGFDLSHAETTDTFRKHVSKGSFDLVVLDLDTEDVDGVRMLNALAAARLAAPVVLVSHCDDRTLDAAQQVGTQRGLRMGQPLVKPLGESSSVRSILDALGIDDPTITAANIRQAIDGGELRLHYQPLVDIKTGAVRSVEALLRWEHPEYGHLNPELVVNLAEQNGLIRPLTDWVMATALAACAEWRKQGWNFRVGINATPELLFESDFADSVVKALDKAGVPPENLVIEITEGQAIAEQLEVLETLARLRLARVSLAIDDFGTGYSSLGRLHSLPFTELKIDKSFVMDTAGDPRLEMVVRAIAELGRNLGLTVIAEGVASREAWDLVESMGCDIAQGYFVSRPLPADKLTEWLYRWDVPTTVTARLPGKASVRKRTADKKSQAPVTPTPARGAGKGTARAKRR